MRCNRCGEILSCAGTHSDGNVYCKSKFDLGKEGNEKIVNDVIKEIAGKKVLVKAKPDNINHPKHYNTGKYEVIDVIEDWKLGFNLGNVIKYLARAEHKENALIDCKKAKWYLERHIKNLENKNEF